MGRFNGFERRADFLIRQCPEVLFDAWHGRQSRVDDLTCNVELDVAVSLGVGEHSPYTLPELPGNRWFRCPYRQSCQHIGLRDPVDSHVAKDRIGVCLQRSMPVDRGFGGSPTRRVRLRVPIRSFPKRRQGRSALLGFWVSPSGTRFRGGASVEQALAKSGLMAVRGIKTLGGVRSA